MQFKIGEMMGVTNSLWIKYSYRKYFGWKLFVAWMD